MSVLLMAANNAKGSSGTQSTKKGLDPQKVKSDIIKALSDPGTSKDLIAVADEILERKRQKVTQSLAGGGDRGTARNLVRLNAKAMGLWKEYEK